MAACDCADTFRHSKERRSVSLGGQAGVLHGVGVRRCKACGALWLRCQFPPETAGRASPYPPRIGAVAPFGRRAAPRRAEPGLKGATAPQDARRPRSSQEPRPLGAPRFDWRAARCERRPDRPLPLVPVPDRPGRPHAAELGTSERPRLQLPRRGERAARHRSRTGTPARAGAAAGNTVAAQPRAHRVTRGALPGRVMLPLPPQTALCLACMWMYAGPEQRAAACAHTKASRHPTIASQTPDPTNGGTR